MPRVSVIIPAFNAEEHIAEALRSVSGQTYDDCSTDGTAERIRSSGDRITLVRTETNSGPAVARNLAIAHSSGELLAFLDTLVPRRAVDEVGGFCPELSRTQDFDLWIRIVEAGYRGRRDAGGLAVHRIRPPVVVQRRGARGALQPDDLSPGPGARQPVAPRAASRAEGAPPQAPDRADRVPAPAFLSPRRSVPPAPGAGRRRATAPLELAAARPRSRPARDLAAAQLEPPPPQATTR